MRGGLSVHFVRAIFSIPLCFLLCSCGPDLLVRTDKPLTLAEVKHRAKTDFPFPTTAHHIYYAIYADWQAAEYLIRFDAPPADCEATVSRALAWHQAKLRKPATYQPRSFTGSVATSSLLHPAAWFDGAVIDWGLFAGEDSSHTPNIWVDLNAGHFYYRSTD